MKKSLVCILSLLLVGHAVFAHQPVELPDPGQVDLSLEYRFAGGIKSYTTRLFDLDNGDLMGMIGYLRDEAYNGSGTGLNSIVEVGLLPGWSMGANVNVPQMLFNGLQQSGWDLDLGLYTNLRLVQHDWYTLNLHGMVKALPLIETSETPGYNLVNAYLMLGSGFELHTWKDGKLSAYADLKMQSTFYNPMYQSAEDFIRSNWVLYDTAGNILTIPDDATLLMYPVQRLALGIGLDLEVSGFFVNLGWNFPLASFVLGFGVFEGLEYSLAHMDLINLELSWRVRL